ncbi:MAG: hypothetical protein J1F28_04320 [Oscillospiraceae bacterium]|nr:hypothetical protein [Oscillospiraceae bacterium]
MDRLTVKSEILDEHYILKCMCSFGRDGVPDDESTCYEYCEMWGDEGCKKCEQCGIQQAFDKLAAYENTGFTPEEIAAMKADNEKLSAIAALRRARKTGDDNG